MTLELSLKKAHNQKQSLVELVFKKLLYFFLHTKINLHINAQ